MYLHQSRRNRRLILTLPLALVGALLASIPSATSVPPDHGPRLARHDETGKVGFIGVSPDRAIDVGLPEGTRPGKVAKTFLQQNARRLGLAARDTTLQVSDEHRSAVGGSTVRVAQVHAGIPVLGGEFTVNLDQTRDVLSVLGEASPIRDVTTRPAVGSDRAAQSAVTRVARQEKIGAGRLAASEPELMFYDPRLLGAPGPFQSARLSWVMEVRSERPAVAHTVVVDAASGTVPLNFSTLTNARNRTVCDANNTASHYPCTSPVWTESSQPAGADADVVAAFDYAGDTYDFFKSRFNRDSLDGAGMPLVSTVDYCPDSTNCPYQNAFWDGSQMVYGDGFAVADDVVGHELAHGFTDFSSSLFYYMQSGAINESMSDIFGEFVDLTNTGGTDSDAVRWLMGEDIPGIGAIRDMENPPAYEQPDRMNSTWYFSGAGDNGGVHYNSGVSNKAAYLLTDGGSFNGRTIGQLGLDKTARLFYVVNNDLLVSGSDFADLANAMRQACLTLAGSGTGGFTSADCDKVEQAILATEMDLNPGNAPTDVVTPCPSGTPAYLYRDDLETPADQFTPMAISGAEVWSYPQNPNDYAGYDATYATSGDTNIWGDNPDVQSDSALRMSAPVTVPTGAFLHFNHAYGFETDGWYYYDGGVLEYSTSGSGGPWVDAGSLLSSGSGAGGYDGIIDDWWGNPLAGRSAFGGQSNGYGSSRADLSALAGQSVMFRWRIGTDSGTGDWGWFIDDISIHTCVVDTTPPETTITSGPTNGSTINTDSATFGFTSNETGSTFQCQLDGGGYSPCASTRTYSSLANGSHTFSVRATDPSGNTDPTPATRTFTVDVETTDTTPPDTTITSGPADGSTVDTSTVTFGFSATETGSTFQCKLDSGSYSSCTGTKTYTSLAQGGHTFSVRAIDPAGNIDPTPATRTFTVDLGLADTTPPDTSITSGPANGSTIETATATFGFTSTEAGSTFQCKLDSGSYSACTSTRTYSSLADGSHTFTVRAIDLAGNVDPTPATRTFTVDAAVTDTTAPTTKITKGPKKRTFKRKAVFAFRSNEAGSRFKCKLDRKRWQACTSRKSYKVKPGRHKFRVKAIDSAGNVDRSPAVWRWRVKRRR